MTGRGDQRSPRPPRRRLVLRWVAVGALTIALLGTVAAAGGSRVAAGRAWLIDPLPSLPVPVPSLPVPSLPVPIPSLPLPSVPLPSIPLPSVPIPSVPIPSLPVPSVPIPSIPVPSLPLPSVSLDPLPSLLPSARPTLSPGAIPLTSGSTPRATPSTPSATQASASVAPSDDDAPGSATPTASPNPSPTPAGDDSVAGAPNNDPPEVHAAAAEDDEGLALGDFVVPALALGVSGLLVLLVVLAQVGAGAAILPAVRRTLGNLGLGRLGRGIEPAGDEPLPPAA